MRQTENLGLALYDTTDKMNVTGPENSLNHNMELIDSELAKTMKAPEAGEAGQVLTKTAEGFEWQAPSASESGTPQELEQLRVDLDGMKATVMGGTSEYTATETCGLTSKGIATTTTFFANVNIPEGTPYSFYLSQDDLVTGHIALYEVDADGAIARVNVFKENGTANLIAQTTVYGFALYISSSQVVASGQITMTLSFETTVSKGLTESVAELEETTGQITRKLEMMEGEITDNSFRLFTDKIVRGLDGGVPDYDGYIATDYIDLSGRRKNSVSLNVMLYSIFGLAFYDKRMKYLSGVCGNNAEEYGYSNISGVQRVTVTLPEECCYIRACMGKGQYGAGTGFDVSYQPLCYKPSYEIPAYYHSDCYFESKYNYIDGLIQEKMANGDAFLFITDEHWSLNQGNSLGLIRALHDFCHIPRLFSGGDNENFGSPEYCRLLAENFGGEIHFVTGNHDYYNHDHQGAILYSYMDIGKENQSGDPNRHYYYVDNRQQKIRYIILSAFDQNAGSDTNAAKNGYEAEQLEWLQNTALDVPADHSVILFTHSLVPGPVEVVSNDVTSIIDAKNTNNNIVAILQGHAHYDWVAHTEGGIPIVVTTCDKNTPVAGFDDYLDSRASGTIQEQAFDVCILDKTERQLIMVRIGCPVREGTEESQWTNSEERVISY